MKYRKRPIVVEAEQWFPGKDVDGVEIRECQVHYSADLSLYYVSKGDLNPHVWMSVEKFPGPVTAEQKANSGFLKGSWAELTPTGEPTYHRRCLPFAEWKVPSGPTEALSEHQDLFLDYAAISGWPESARREPPQSGWVETLEGRMLVSPGDWIITGVQGEKYPCKPEIFAATYEPAEESEGPQ